MANQRVDISRDSVHIPPSAMDEHGLVFCWSVADKKWRKLWPIDAREGIGVGAYSLQGPDGVAEEDNAPPPAEDREAAFGAMPKATLRGYCVDNDVSHSGADTKVSLVKRLVGAGVIPK